MRGRETGKTQTRQLDGEGEREERCVQGGGSSELQRLSLSRVAPFNLPIYVAPLWLKIECL